MRQLGAVEPGRCDQRQGAADKQHDYRQRLQQRSGGDAPIARPRLSSTDSSEQADSADKQHEHGHRLESAVEHSPDLERDRRMRGRRVGVLKDTANAC